MLNKWNVPSLSQQRRCSANLCIRVLTERAAGVSDLVFVFPFSIGWTNEALLEAVTCSSEVISAEWWLVELEGTGCMFSELEAWVSTLLGQSLFDGDGFVPGLSVQVRIFKQISIQSKIFSEVVQNSNANKVMNYFIIHNMLPRKLSFPKSTRHNTLSLALYNYF